MHKLFFILVFALCSSFTALHEFHLSKSTINFDTESHALQITMHIFIDDLEVALASRGIEGLKIGTERESTESDKHIANYIAEHMQLYAESDTLEQHFLGKELSADLLAIWCYIEISDVSLTEISIMNNLLTEIYDDQKNIIAVKKNKKRVDDIILDKKKFTTDISI